MKKLCKKIIAFTTIMMLVFSAVQISAGAAKVGSVIGYALPTDIIATINGYQLQSYNVNDYTYICVEDLQYYGFKVDYNNAARTLSLSLNPWTTQIAPDVENPGFWNIGTLPSKKSILYTNIVTYVNGRPVTSSNINGYTIINFEELAQFGEVAYNDSTRKISLTMDHLNYNIVDTLADLLQEDPEMTVSDDWYIRYRAKGDVLMLLATATSYGNSSQIKNFIATEIPEDKQYMKELLYSLQLEGIPVSSIYVEYRNTNGTLITSYQIP